MCAKRAHALPPLRQAVDQAVARHAGGHRVEEQLVQIRQQEPDGGHGRRGLEVVVGRRDRHAAPPSARERPDLDRGFRVQRDAQGVGGRVRYPIDDGHLGEDGVGRGDLFWGCVLATVWG